MATLGGNERMQLVEHDVAQVLKKSPCVASRYQQRKLFGGSEQNVRRRQLLPLPLVSRGIACPRLDRDGQADFLHRLAKVAFNVDRKSLERRDVERVHAASRLTGPARAPLCQFGQGRQEASESLARPRWRYQQGGLPCLAAREKFKLMRARRPALPREPFYEWLRQAGRKFRFGRARFGGHAPQVARTGRSAKRKQNKTGSKSVLSPSHCSLRGGVGSLARQSSPCGIKAYLENMRPRDLLCPKPEGLYCAPGDFFIDPVRPVARALVTHGH